METRQKGNKRYIFIVSDATGKTATRIVNAAMRQFKTTEAVLEIESFIRTDNQIDALFDKAAKVNGIIVHTVVLPTARRRIDEKSRLTGVPVIDLLGPMLTRFSDLLEISPMAQPGLLKQLNSAYFQRIEAVDFTIKHDDGMGIKHLPDAEIVLVGVSRTSKTPVSIYLSYRGWKVANVPIVMGHPPPEELFAIDQNRIVAMTIKPSRLQLIRMERQYKLHNSGLNNYTDSDEVRNEVNYGMVIYRKYGYPILDVTYKSIEETATEVMRLIYANTGIKKGHIEPDATGFHH